MARLSGRSNYEKVVGKEPKTSGGQLFFCEEEPTINLCNKSFQKNALVGF
ncbi:MAG: hypothetical protein ACJAWV_003212 [Flammeovirgaceae bacterium]|jgi:hypothetical protein